MAGIKISDLPPNTLPLVGDEKMELEDANGDSTQATVQDIASAASGLDATFITVSANAALPNERVLTAGTNISLVDGGPNSTITINAAGLSFPILAPDGSAAAPSYSFTNDPGAGMFLTALGELSFAADGVEIARALNLPFNQFAITPSGSSAVPELAGLTDLDTGFRWPADNTTVWMGGGSRAWNFTTVKFHSQFSDGPALMNRLAQSDVPTVVPDHADDNTGLGANGNDELSLIAGGVEIAQAKEAVGANQFIVAPGVIQNAAATPSLAFGDGDTGFSEPLDDNFKVSVAGVFRFFWELDAFNAEVGTGPAMRNEAVSGTNPTFIPRRSDPDTGIGSSASNEVSLIGGGVELARAVAAASGGLLANNTLTGGGIERVLTISDAFAGVPDPLLLSDGSAAAPSYSFTSDTDIGMFRVGADILGLSARATLIAQAVGAIGSNQFVVAPGAIQNNQSAPDLGFGDGNTGFLQTAEDVLATVVGGTQAIRFEEMSGQAVQINNNQTGLVASVTQTQAGGLALINSYNEVTTVANAGDALTAFSVLEGSRLVIINNGVNDLQLFPDVGDDFGAGVDTAITIALGDIGIFIGRDTVNWDTLYNAPSTPGAGPGGVLPAGTVVDAGLKWDGASAWIEETQVRLTGGASGIQVFDATLADFIRMGHNGVDALFAVNAATTNVIFGLGGGPTGQWRFLEPVLTPSGVVGAVGLGVGAINTGFYLDGLGLHTSITGVEQMLLSNATTQFFSDDIRLINGADFMRWQVDPPTHPGDFLMTMTSMLDFHIRGVGAERFVLEELNLAMIEKAAAPGDVAGVGQFWVRDDAPNIPMYTDDVGTDFKLGVANDAVQARRTTSYVLTTAFADVTLDTTDIETDAAIVEHNGVSTDNIEAIVAGTYEITYGADIDPSAAGNDNIRAFGRIRVNDGGVDLPGSLASQSAYEDASTIGNQVFGRLQCSFIVTLAAADFVTLQLMKVEIGGTGIFTAEEVTVTVKRLL